MQYSSFDLKPNYLHSQNLSVMPNMKNIRHEEQWIIYSHIYDAHPFQQDTVLLHFGLWTEDVSLQVSDITQCPVRELYLNNNQRATMVKEMAHIHFALLTHLQLNGNTIESVEGLARVHMAHIKLVRLSSSSITSVGVIRKAAWPRLQQLYIEDNYFKDASNLVQGCFLHLQTLSVYDLQRDGKNKSSEECFPAKTQAALRYLYIRENRFCFDRCLKTVLQEIWPNTVIK